jgi:hypothetical protein
MTHLRSCIYRGNERPFPAPPKEQCRKEVGSFVVHFFGGKDRDPFERLTTTHSGRFALCRLHNRNPGSEFIKPACRSDFIRAGNRRCAAAGYGGCSSAHHSCGYWPDSVARTSHFRCRPSREDLCEWHCDRFWDVAGQSRSWG